METSDQEKMVLAPAAGCPDTEPFTPEQMAAIRRICAETWHQALRQDKPIPYQQAQLYLQRVCPPMIERVIQQEKPGITRDIRKELEEQGAQIMVGRFDEVRQKVNDWMDRELRQSSASIHTSLTACAEAAVAAAVQRAMRDESDAIKHHLQDIEFETFSKELVAAAERASTRRMAGFWVRLWRKLRVWMNTEPDANV